MALGIEKISTDLVGTTLGTSSRDVGTLCKHSAVNMWSRYRPGVWTTENGLVAFKKPDSISVDNRYPAPDYRNKFAYHLGDFRGYNHNALPIRLISSNNVIVEIPENVNSVSKSFDFRIGEVDWKSVDAYTHAHNWFNNPTHFLLYDKDVNVKLQTVPISTNNDELQTFTLTFNASDNGKSYNYILGIGNDLQKEGYFDFMTAKYTILVLERPKYTWYETSNFRSQLINLAGEHIALPINFNPPEVKIMQDSTSATCDLQISAIGDNTGNIYAFDGTNGTVDCTLQYIDKNGTETSENKTLSYKTGASGISISIIFSHALQFGERVNIYINNITNLYKI